jgi:hypothetical protein
MGFQVDEPWHTTRSKDGRLKVLPSPSMPGYASDIDESGATSYYGFLDENGNWCIMEVTATSVRYAAGTSDYTTNWTGRALLEYGYFNAVF